jgi:alkaline phosphatase
MAGVAGAVPFPSLRASVPAASHRSPDSPVGRARNVIFYAWDGFGWEDLGTARFFADRHENGRVLALERLLSGGASGMMLPHSLSSIVTDSAAASAAWATGRKIMNGELSRYPNGTPLTTILELARDRGRATGLVTSTRLTHATPAAWIARVDDRDKEDEIALQYLDFAPDVLLGGGSRHFDAVRRADGRDLFGEFAARGYQLLREPEDLHRVTGSRLLGAFSQDHLPYEIDRRFQGVPSPTLAELTRTGLEVLSGGERGFLLQVEAGRIDHANHQNDPAAMVRDVIAADDALAVIIDFVDRNPDTVLILASDHATGSGAVYGSGSRYADSNRDFDSLALREASQELLLRRLGREPSAAEVRGAIDSLMKVRLSAGDAERAAESLARVTAPAHPHAHGNDRSRNLNFVLSSTESPEGTRLNFNYATGAHTAGPVPVLVYGAGTSAAGLGVVDNTELFDWMLHALDIRFENPALGTATARELTAATG